MEFRRFSRAVNNHGDQEYTMCDFLNLVKVTARDIQDEYGADVAELEWGDEKQLADLIANQCFVIGEMLDAVSSGGGSTGRIESLRKEIGTLRERSLSLKKSAEDIAALETKKQELSGQLEALNKQKAVYDELQQSIVNTQKAIDEADRFDPAAAQAQLTALEATLNEKTNNNAALSQKIETHKNSIAQADSACGKLHGEINVLEQSVIRKETEKRQKETEKAAAQNMADALDNEKQVIEQAIKQLESVIKEKQNDEKKRNSVKEQLQQRIAALTEEAKTRETDIKTLRASIRTLQDKKTADIEEKEKLTGQKTELENADARLAAAIELLKVYAHADSQKKLDDIRTRLDKLVSVQEQVRKMLLYISEITGGRYIIIKTENSLTHKNAVSQAEEYQRALNDLLTVIPEIQKMLADTVSQVSDEMNPKEMT